MKSFLPMMLVLGILACSENKEAEPTAAGSALPPKSSAGKPPAPPQPPTAGSGGATNGQTSGSSGTSNGSYTVAAGDTLLGIARTHNIRAKDLAAWNNIADPNRIREGQTLRMTAP